MSEPRCWMCRHEQYYCTCADDAEEARLFHEQERAYWGDDDEPTGRYVWTPTERQQWEDNEREQDTGTWRDE